MEATSDATKRDTSRGKEFSRIGGRFVYLAHMMFEFFSPRPDIRPITLLLLTLVLDACAGGEPLDTRDRDEDGSRPGALSGKAGEFVIFSK